MSDDKIELTKKDFSFICPINKEELDKVDGGYHCYKCNQKVINVSDMTKQEFYSLISNNENVCISFKKVVSVTMALSVAASAVASNIESVKQKDSNTTIATTKDTNSSSNQNNLLKPYKIVNINSTAENNKSTEITNLHVTYKVRLMGKPWRRTDNTTTKKEQSVDDKLKKKPKNNK